MDRHEANDPPGIPPQGFGQGRACGAFEGTVHPDWNTTAVYQEPRGAARQDKENLVDDGDGLGAVKSC